MKEIWGKEKEKLIHKEVFFFYPISTLQWSRIFAKPHSAVVIMQTYVRGGNDPAELRQSLYSRGKFEICRSAVAHMMRTASRYKK